jgi:hypothetical protein
VRRIKITAGAMLAALLSWAINLVMGTPAPRNDHEACPHVVPCHDGEPCNGASRGAPVGRHVAGPVMGAAALGPASIGPATAWGPAALGAATALGGDSIGRTATALDDVIGTQVIGPSARADAWARLRARRAGVGVRAAACADAGAA